jgi:catalase
VRLRKILWWTTGLFALAACWVLYRAYATPPLGPMGEVIDPEEEVLTSQILSNGVSIVNANKTGGVVHRDGHPKNQGCALASFTVPPLDWPYRQGLFAEAKTYKAWIRFSSGNPTIQSDWYPDARGMAIKVLGVPGAKILEGDDQARTQDFLMINNPAFFIKNVQEYSQLTRLQAIGYEKKSNLAQFGYFFNDDSGDFAGPSSWRIRELRIAIQMLKWPPRNLLATQFYSISAFTLGVQNYVKYSARPTACGSKESIPGSMVWSLGSDALRNQLTDQLKSNRACFDLLAQTQVPQKNMPVEDTTTEWRESDSPFFTVARIEIQKQDIGQYFQTGFCENLTYSPWHALPQHRPVGGLNRIRKAVYQGIAQYRHCENGAPTGEPEEDGSPKFVNRACAANQPYPESAAKH